MAEIAHPPSRQRRMAVADWGLLLLLSVLFGGSFFFVKVIVAEVPPFTLVFARFFVGAGALWLYVRARRMQVPRSLAPWMAFAGMGALNNLIPGALVAWSQKTLAGGYTAILIATTPIFSILAAHCLTADEKMSVNKIAGAALGISGVAVMVGIDSLDSSEGSMAAILACLAAALSYGLANVFGRRFARLGIAPTVVAFGQLAMTAAMAMPLMLGFDAPWSLPIPSAKVLGAIAGVSLLSTALAFVIFFRVLARAGGTNISLNTLLTPVSAILLGTLILGERLSAVQFGGMTLISLGLIVIDGRVFTSVRLARIQRSDFN